MKNGYTMEELKDVKPMTSEDWEKFAEENANQVVTNIIEAHKKSSPAPNTSYYTQKTSKKKKKKYPSKQKKASTI